MNYYLDKIGGVIKKIIFFALLLFGAATTTASVNKLDISNQTTLEKTDRSAVQNGEFVLNQPCGLVGDLNQDGKVTLSDVILYANAIFGDNSVIRNLTPKCILDVNSDGVLLTLADVVWLGRHILKGIPLPHKTCCD